MYWQARERSFPEVNLRAGGGCTVHRETRAERRYCEVCREARSAWLNEHPEFAQVE